jgi:hypothetical protein
MARSIATRAGGAAGKSAAALTRSVKMPAFLAVDMFSGAGGTTRGLLDAGGYVIAGIDKDSKCERTYTENNGNVTLDRKPPYFFCRDIFPRSENHPEGQQQKLKKELTLLLDRYRDSHPAFRYSSPSALPASHSRLSPVRNCPAPGSSVGAKTGISSPKRSSS